MSESANISPIGSGFDDYLREEGVLEETHAYAARTAWRPIATAPMDGTVIRLLQGGEVFAGFCGDDPNYPWQFLDRNGRHAIINGFRHDFSPSHWKPLDAGDD